jgi:hypothetical protein
MKSPSIACKRKVEGVETFLGVFDLFLQVLDIQSWGVGNIPHNAHRWIKKDEDIQTFIHHPMCACGECEDGMR